MDDPVLLSRLQFALTLSFHILFPTLTIGLSAYILGWEIAWRRTGKDIYRQLCRFWTKIFALGFGLGVVSGIVLSYEFGTNFARFSELTGNVLAPLMSYEVLTAFFLEAGFLGIMLFGWERVSPRMHLLATAMVALGALMSTFWILSANSWMHTPAGYRIGEGGVFFVTSWREVIFNPSFPYRLAHMVTASYLTVSFVVAGVASWYLLKGRFTALAKHALAQSMLAALLLAPLQIFLGDLHGLNTLHYQPIKLAAIEGRWDTERQAPLTLFAWPDMEAERNRYALELPKLGSLLLTHEWQGEIVGLKSVPREDRPHMIIPFFAFRIMVGIGMILLLTALTGAILRARKKLDASPWFWRWSVAVSPLGFVAVLTGWYTTETGRQPWVVQGLLRTGQAASDLPASSVAASLITFAVIYTVILAAFLFYFCRLVKKGPAAAMTDTPEQLSGWVEKTP